MTPEDGQEPEDPALLDRFHATLTGSWKTQALSVAARLRLADLLAAGPRTSADLAAATDTNPAALHRLLRALTTIDVCAECNDGRFALTAFGALLREDSLQSQRAWTIWWGSQLGPLWDNLLYSVTTGESARKKLRGTDGFAHLEQSPETAAIFNRAGADHMRAIAGRIIALCDFDGLRIVDVGGGHGLLLLTILRAHPSATGILFDLAHAIDGATPNFDSAGLGDRCQLVRGDFFASVPVGGDLYILKHVLHNWDDAHSLCILRNCRQAMPPSARLLVMETLLPERFGTSAAGQAMARSDLTMLVAHAAQERTERAFRALLNASGFAVSRLVAAASDLTIIEARPVG